MYPHSQKQNVFFLTILLYFQTIFKQYPTSEKKDILSAPTVAGLQYWAKVNNLRWSNSDFVLKYFFKFKITMFTNKGFYMIFHDNHAAH